MSFMVSGASRVIEPAAVIYCQLRFASQLSSASFTFGVIQWSFALRASVASRRFTQNQLQFMTIV